MATRTLEVKITGDTKSLDRALGRTKQGFASSAKSAAIFAAKGAAVAGVGLAVRKVVTDTVAFDKSMRNVNSIAQLNEKQFRKLEDSVLSLAGPTAQAPNTLAEGLYDLVSSGFDAKESLTILESSAKAATAGLTTTEVSTKAVAAVLNAYRLPAKKARDVSDVLFRTVDRGVVSFEELSANIGDALPFASSLGVNLREVGAATATMTKAGISAPETITRIKNVMVAMLKPSAGMKEALHELGVESGEALIKQRGFQGALEALIGTTDGTKTSVAKIFPEIRAMGGALALTGKNAKGAGEDLKGMQEASGATDRALSQQSKSISYWWDKLKAKASELAIRAGLAVMRMVDDFRHGRGEVTKAVKEIGHALGPVLGRFIAGAKQFFQGFAQAVKGIAQIISGVLTGDFKKAWKGVQNLFGGGAKAALGMLRAMTAPAREIAAKVGEALGNAFSGAWDKVTDIFKSGVGAAKGFIDTLIDAINALPFVPDIDKPGGGKKPAGPKGPVGKQRGGFLMGGAPSGDTIPAMLERGEYVLNRNAVKKIGAAQLDALNFGAAPRFQGGGKVAKLQVGGFGLPSGDSLGGAFAALGPWLVEQAVEWVKGKQKKFGSFSSRLGAAPGALGAVEKLAGTFGLTMTSGYRPGDLDSWHGKNRARDFSNGVNTPQMRSFALAVAGKWGSRLLEMFYDPLGWYIDNGSKIRGAIGGHSDHVHVAMQRGGRVGNWRKMVGSTWDNNELATLAHFVGMANPGLMAQIAQGESSGIANNVGHDAGGTEGLGLWQITTGFNDDIIAKYGGRTAMFDPIKNAKAAKEILARQGIGAWYAPPTGPKGQVDPQLMAAFQGRASGGGPAEAPEMGLASRSNPPGKPPKVGRRQARGRKHAGIGTGQKAGRAIGKGGGAPAEAGEPATDPAVEAAERQREATEELQRVIEEHMAEEKALREELEQTRHLAESELAVSSAVARRALADIISGQLGPRSSHRAMTAGAGTVGSM